MRSRLETMALAVVALVLFVAPASTFAYAINSGSDTTVGTNAGVSGGLNLTSSWTQLSAPFQNFFNSLGSVNPNDLPNEIVNPSTQIQSMIPAADKGFFFEALNFVSLVIGQLIKISDWIAHFVVSMSHGA